MLHGLFEEPSAICLHIWCRGNGHDQRKCPSKSALCLFSAILLLFLLLFFLCSRQWANKRNERKQQKMAAKDCFHHFGQRKSEGEGEELNPGPHAALRKALREKAAISRITRVSLRAGGWVSACAGFVGNKWITAYWVIWRMYCIITLKRLHYLDKFPHPYMWRESKAATIAASYKTSRLLQRGLMSIPLRKQS